jgi:uncharacterized protein (TIGR03435 family)
MSPLALSILVKATLTLVLALVGARLARNRRAATRHVLLAAAFAILLVLPIASIVIPSIQIAVPVMARENSAPPSFGPLSHVVSSVAVTAPSAGVTEARPPAFRISVLGVLLAGWLAGIAVFFAPVVVGLRQTYSLCRTGRSWREGQSRLDRLASEAGIRRRVRVLLHESVRCPMTCGIVSTAVILPMESQAWTEEEVTRAIVHELEHVRRGDWLNGCLSRAVCACYWFHPLVWVAWRQLRLEAERACDDAVLRHADPTAYADQLVVLAQHLATQANLVSPAMAGTGDLPTRVRAILDARQQRGRAGLVCGALACVVSMLFVGSISPLRLVTVASQAGGNFAVEQLEFEVASVRPSHPPADPWYAKGFSTDITKGALTAQNVTLRQLLEMAYRTQESRIVDGPSWLSSDRFDVIAKSRSDATREQVSLMLQTLLGERFKVRLHKETRNLPIYTLEIAKGGPKLEILPEKRFSRHDGDCTVAPPVMSKSGKPLLTLGGICGEFNLIGDSKRGGIYARAITLSPFATALSTYVERPVFDKTGLTGLFNFALSWAEPSTQTKATQSAEHGNQTEATQSSEFEANSVFTAVQDQLGLRLVSGRGPVEVFVLDQAAQPTSN